MKLSCSLSLWTCDKQRIRNQIKQTHTHARKLMINESGMPKVLSRSAAFLLISYIVFFFFFFLKCAHARYLNGMTSSSLSSEKDDLAESERDGISDGNMAAIESFLLLMMLLLLWRHLSTKQSAPPVATATAVCWLSSVNSKIFFRKFSGFLNMTWLCIYIID